MSKPFSQACENNKQPILRILEHYFQPGELILEVGSGTGQHALHFTAQHPQWRWQSSEIPDNMATIEAGLAGVANPSLPSPVVLDVTQQPWPLQEADGLFSANCLHIMPWMAVEQFFLGAARVLHPGAYLCVYGPFKYGGRFTSASNADFDRWLKARDPRSGVRDFETVERLAQGMGFGLVADHAMPANNQLLVWRRRAPLEGSRD